MPGFEIIDKKERNSILKLFDKDNGVLFAHGYEKIRNKYHVREFEKELEKKFKSKYSLAVSSGTAAIKVALKTVGIKPGDEVITQAFNFIATVEAIIDSGAKPIICSVDKNLNMDLDDLQKKITKKTKAIIPVHMLGQSVEIEKIIKIAKKKKIFVIEDNCESVGGKYKKKYLGTLADIGILSFDFGKTITTGEGGAILTNNQKFYKIAKEYHDHGHKNKKGVPRGMDIRARIGFNYRMTEMQAVIGKVQLKKLDFIIRENKKRYLILDSLIKKKFIIRNNIPNSEGIFDTFIFFEKNKTKRNKIIKILNKNKIGTKNLPDAIKWHCSYYWGHAINSKEVRNSKPTKNLLENSIAIPILLSKKISSYKEVSNKIASLSEK